MVLSKPLLKQVINEQNQAIRKKIKRYVNRDLEKVLLRSAKKDDLVVVLSGVRRAGKSTLFGYLKEKHLKPSYYINFDDDRLINFSPKDYQTLLEVFIELFGKAKYVFLDEIQNVPYWERFANRLKEQGYKVFVTGSNSKLLSKEFGTYLTGRYIEFKLYPFSFKEYLRFRGIDVTTLTTQLSTSIDTDLKVLLLKHLKTYMKFGGFPEFLTSRNIEFLKTLYESILYKDIIGRYSIKAEGVLKQIAHIAAGNIARPISFRAYRSLGIKSSTTVAHYFDYLTSTYLFFLVRKFAFSVRSQFLSKKKLYMIDNALARYVGFRPTPDEGRFLENLVFLHLVRRSKSAVYYFSNTHNGSNVGECDFVVLTETLEGKQVSLLQVTLELNDNNRQRELKGLLEAYRFFKDAHYSIKSLYIVTLDQYDDITVSFEEERLNIKVLPAWHFLLTL